jgi:hypothetical protein
MTATTAPRTQKACPDGAPGARATCRGPDSGDDINAGEVWASLRSSTLHVILPHRARGSALLLRASGLRIVSSRNHDYAFVASLSRGGTVLSGKILVVDDDAVVRLTTRDFLSSKATR